ncbi:MAG: cell division protein ZapA [Piscirickettsiaceae bacterium]|nr:cell division protein ZapA [Piscirickettsiaceae bacterium]
MSSPVLVKISGKEYQISCPEEEKKGLIASAELLHNNMEDIRATGKIVGTDRIAVMAALNLAHDLITLRDEDGSDANGLNQKILLMKEKVSNFLDEERQLDL